jgi:hypothetical protein
VINFVAAVGSFPLPYIGVEHHAQDPILRGESWFYTLNFLVVFDLGVKRLSTTPGHDQPWKAPLLTRVSIHAKRFLFFGRQALQTFLKDNRFARYYIICRTKSGFGVRHSSEPTAH